jgi:hypothetical protein
MPTLMTTGTFGELAKIRHALVGFLLTSIKATRQLRASGSRFRQ